MSWTQELSAVYNTPTHGQGVTKTSVYRMEKLPPPIAFRHFINLHGRLNVPPRSCAAVNNVATSPSPLSNLLFVVLSRRTTDGVNLQVVSPALYSDSKSDRRGAGAGSGKGTRSSSMSNKRRPPSLQTNENDHHPVAVASTSTAAASERTERNEEKHEPNRLLQEENPLSVRTTTTVAQRTTTVSATMSSERHVETTGEGGGGGREGRTEAKKSASTEGTEAVLLAPIVSHDPPITQAMGRSPTKTSQRTMRVATAAPAHSAGAAGVRERPVAATADDVEAKKLLEYGQWLETLDARWAEVEFMLCRAVDSEESLRYTTEATEAGLVFMDNLEKKAQVWWVLVQIVNQSVK